MTTNYPPPTPASGGHLIGKVLVNNLYYLKLCGFLCNLSKVYLHRYNNCLTINIPRWLGLWVDKFLFFYHVLRINH